MFVLVENDSITKTVSSNRGITIGENQYPQAIFSAAWSTAEREAIGLYEVVFDNSNKKDEKYYINTNQSLNFADGVATASFGTATAKLLEDRNEVDEAGEPLLDDKGNQVVTKGLKTEHKDIIKRQASGLLAPTDWYVIKATDVESYSVPEAITTYRADVRSTSNTMETAIDNAADVDALAALYEYTGDPGSQTRPLGEWPEEV
jgi:hypothetical protein